MSIQISSSRRVISGVLKNVKNEIGWENFFSVMAICHLIGDLDTGREFDSAK